MVLDNAIFARWFLTTADLADFESLVEQYVCSEKQTLANEIFAITWRERTQLSFGATDWSSTEDSLILENKRAILWRKREAFQDLYDLIFVALMQSSLFHLCKGIAAILKEKRDADLVPLYINLNKLTKPLDERLVGIAIANAKEDRIIVSGVNPFQHLSVPFPFPDDSEIIGNDPSAFSVSEIYLRLGPTKTDVGLSPDGFLTFTNPQVTISEIAQCISDITGMFGESS
jgi:hypothetical protein